MAIPDYQSLMLPLLRLLGDGVAHSRDECVELLADHFRLTAGERRERHPSGAVVLRDRVGWAVTYLKHARLIESTGRKTIRITERGHQALADSPPRIDKPYLFRYRDFAEWYARAGSGRGRPVQMPVDLFRVPEPPPHDVGGTIAADTPDLRSGPKSEPLGAGTPAEILESSYQTLRRMLANELLERINSCSPRLFEQLVIDVLGVRGYGSSRRDTGRILGRTADGGFDRIMKGDKADVDFHYIQATRLKEPISRPTVQTLAESLGRHRARTGVLITTFRFTRDAEEYVTRIEKRIVLIDGEQLAQLMIDHGIGVADVATYHVKELDNSYFDEE